MPNRGVRAKVAYAAAAAAAPSPPAESASERRPATPSPPAASASERCATRRSIVSVRGRPYHTSAAKSVGLGVFRVSPY